MEAKCQKFLLDSIYTLFYALLGRIKSVQVQKISKAQEMYLTSKIDSHDFCQIFSANES